MIAVALSLGDLLRRVARPHDGILGYVSGLAGMHDVDDFPEAEQVPGLVVYRYDSPLFFANAEDFHHRALAAVTERAPGGVAAHQRQANVEVDLTSLRARSPPPRAGRRAAWYATLPTAVAAYLEWHEEEHGRQHPFGPVSPPPAPPPTTPPVTPAGS